jgi:hypothetical protein
MAILVGANWGQAQWGGIPWGGYDNSGGTSPVTESLSDQLSLSDAVAAGLGIVVHDQFTFTDTFIGVSPASGIMVADFFGFSDSQQYSLTGVTGDAFLLQDQVLVLLNVASTFSDALNLSDSTFIANDIPLSGAAESLSFSDTFSSTLLGALQFQGSEQLNLVENLTVLKIGNLTLAAGVNTKGFPNEGFVLSDGLLTKSTGTFSFNDQLFLNDTLQAIVPQGGSNSESFNLSDSVEISITDTIINIPIILGDGFNLMDVPGYQGSEIELLQLTEALSLGDTLVVSQQDSLNSYLRRYLNDVQFQN